MTIRKFFYNSSSSSNSSSSNSSSLIYNHFPPPTTNATKAAKRENHTKVPHQVVSPSSRYGMQVAFPLISVIVNFPLFIANLPPFSYNPLTTTALFSNPSL